MDISDIKTTDNKFVSTTNYKLIYVYKILDESHADLLKVGETTIADSKAENLTPNSEPLNRAAHARIDPAATTMGIAFELLHTELAVTNDGKAFGDTHVHRVLQRSGIKKEQFKHLQGRPQEWFKTNLHNVKMAIEAVKNGRKSINPNDLSDAVDPIILRDEQNDAIEQTKKRFASHNDMLWYAKMRYGKTSTALALIKQMGYRSTLIYTHRPVVNDAWSEDFPKIFVEQDTPFKLGSKDRGCNFDELVNHFNQGGNIIYFTSLQYLWGYERVGGKVKSKEEALFDIDWDLIIIDEAHEGTQTQKGQKVLSELKREHTKVLELSGTPFNILYQKENDAVFTWDYVMEQLAKANWAKMHPLEPNPYADLPQMRLYTYDITKIREGRFSAYVKGKAFTFSEFFRVWTGEIQNDGGKMPSPQHKGRFVHEDAVKDFLNLLCGSADNDTYPFATQDYQDYFRHSFWVLPGVAEAKALAKMLRNHPTFKNFKVVNVAGSEEVKPNETLESVKQAIANNPYTITLSCGKLTTGITIHEWTAVLYLAGSYETSAQIYMQTIFRVQSTGSVNGKQKTQCYAFDFAPDRTLRVVAEAATHASGKRATGGTKANREGIKEFLNFCPVIAVKDSGMEEYNVNSLMQQLKQIFIAHAIDSGFTDDSIFNYQIKEISENDLQKFEHLGSHHTSNRNNGTVTTVSSDMNKQQGDGTQEKQPPKPQKPKTPEEIAAEAQRKRTLQAEQTIKDTLKRVPIMLYGADIPIDKDVDIEEFIKLVDDESWKLYMPKDVTPDDFRNMAKYVDMDVFIGAASEYRHMVKVADADKPLERIRKITSIIANFRNPDKETVLTPWRVVNMHLSDCLGGYDFYDDRHEYPIVDGAEPRFVDRGEVTAKVFNSETRILEINSKTGLYPLFMAYSIFRSRMESAATGTDENEVWQQVLKENVFVVGMSAMSEMITLRTLRGFNDWKCNTCHIDGLINRAKTQQKELVETLSNLQTYNPNNSNTMIKFNAVIGNPPYQVMDGGAGASATPIYNHFVTIAKKLNPNFISLITPSRWFSGGKGLDKYRDDMIHDHRISKMFNFLNGKDCFPSSSTGSINYFLWDINHTDLCDFHVFHNGTEHSEQRALDEFNILVGNNIALSIIRKILAKKESCFSTNVRPYKPFGLRSYVRGVTEKKDNMVALISSEGISYINRAEITACNDIIDDYKIMTSKLLAEHAGEPDKIGKYKVLSRTEIIEPGVICTESYLILAAAKDKKTIDNYYSYCCTKFFRFMLLQAMSSINMTSEVFQFVPDQDFSIRWTDAELYKKYKLTPKETSYIESMIKPMGNTPDPEDNEDKKKTMTLNGTAVVVNGDIHVHGDYIETQNITHHHNKED